MNWTKWNFVKLGSFSEGGSGVFWLHAGGPGPRGMHPDCDEFLQILKGVSTPSRIAALFNIIGEPGLDEGLIRHITLIGFDFNAIQ